MLEKLLRHAPGHSPHAVFAKRQLAEREDFAIGDESVNWIANQLLEMFMRSAFVEEIFADDATLRERGEALRAALDLDAEIPPKDWYTE